MTRGKCKSGPIGQRSELLMIIELNLWTSIGIMVSWSLMIVALDELVMKRWREKMWEKRAARGDPEARELLRVAGSAKVYEE
jgi:hypothetical protein